MIIVSLVLSIGIVFAVIHAVCSRPRPILWLAGWFFSMLLGCALLMMFPTPVFVQCLALAPLVIFCSVSKRSPRVIVAGSIAITLVTYACLAVVSWREVDRLLARFPMESLESRAPRPGGEALVPDETMSRLIQLEELIDKDNLIADGFFAQRRNRQLEDLHFHTFSTFISRPGFGASRMSIDLRSLDAEMNRDLAPPIPQPKLAPPPALSAKAATEIAESRIAPDVFSPMHRKDVALFTRPDRLGLFIDRRHVAGFEPHHFTQTPEPAQGRLERVELLGLVVHSEPVVYVSDNLPRMQDLAAMLKRPPDAFEKLGLDALRNGDDLFVRDSGPKTRVLGAVRALKRCLACHDCEHGRLLGAFSYTLTR